tara:strand:+ start:698 stop:1087 length:390 start_codon:yes stop_codon:yes gene_type:complete
MSSKEMYREHILDLYKNPLNYGSLENPTHVKSKNNPLCGDKITLHLKIEDKIIKDAKFVSEGCAISIASASIFTEKIKGLSINEAKKISREDMIKMMQIPISEAREKCALLCFDTLKENLEDISSQQKL